MYVGRDFSVMNVGENEVFSFNFVNDLPTGDSLVSTVWTIEVEEGADPAPATHLDGTPGISGTTSMQRISGTLPNVKYRIISTVETALGNTLVLYSHFPCLPPN